MVDNEREFDNAEVDIDATDADIVINRGAEPQEGMPGGEVINDEDDEDEDTDEDGEDDDA